MQTRKDVKDHDQIIRQNVETKKRHVKPLQMTTKNSSNQKMSETRRESQFIRTMEIEEILVKSKDAKNRVSVHSNNEKILVKTTLDVYIIVEISRKNRYILFV